MDTDDDSVDEPLRSGVNSLDDLPLDWELPAAELPLSNLSLEVSKKRVTELHRRVSDRTNQFLQSYVIGGRESENADERATANLSRSLRGEFSVPGLTPKLGDDLANFFQKKLLASESRTAITPSEDSEHKSEPSSKKLSAGEVFRQELKAIKERGAINRKAREQTDADLESHPFAPLSPENESPVPSGATLEDSRVAQVSESPLSEQPEAQSSIPRKISPERQDPDFPFPSYFEEGETEVHSSQDQAAEQDMGEPEELDLDYAQPDGQILFQRSFQEDKGWEQQSTEEIFSRDHSRSTRNSDISEERTIFEQSDLKPKYQDAPEARTVWSREEKWSLQTSHEELVDISTDSSTLRKRSQKPNRLEQMLEDTNSFEE